MEVFDVLVVGAGPAGSTLAGRLARAGWRVGLLDKKRFPRFKPCGEFLSPACIPLLEELGVHRALLALGTRRVDGMVLHGHGHHASGSYGPIGSSAPPAPFGLAVRREVLDHELVRLAAAHENVTLLEGWRCDGLLRRPGPRGTVYGIRAMAPDQSTHELHAVWTIGADGLHSKVATALGVRQRLGWLDRFALTARFEGVPEQPSAELHLFPGGYFAGVTVENGEFSVNLVIERSRLATRTNGANGTNGTNGTDGTIGWDAFLAEHLELVPAFAERIAAAVRTTKVRGTGPLAWRSSRQVVGGAALVGDACGYVDPMTGEGIYFAMRGASLLAADLDVALRTRSNDASALRRYARQRRREIAPSATLSKLLQRLIRSERCSRRMLASMATRPGLADLMVSLTGDYVRYRELLRPGVWQRALRRPPRA